MQGLAETRPSRANRTTVQVRRVQSLYGDNNAFVATRESRSRRCSAGGNLKRIVQTDDYVMVLIEMVHDARNHPDECRARPGPRAQLARQFGVSLGS